MLDESVDTKAPMLEGFNQAKSGLEETPSQIMPVIRETAVLGTGVFRIFSGLDALYNIKLIYNEYKKDYKEGTKVSLVDHALRGLRILGNLGVIAFSGIAAAAAFGATVIAAPIVGVVLSAITLYKNTADLLSERRRGVAIQKKFDVLNKELKKSDIHLEQNVELLKDLQQRQEKITGLLNQYNNIDKALSSFKNSPESEKVKLIEDYKSELQSNIKCNKAIDVYVGNMADNLNNPTEVSESVYALRTQSDLLNKQISALSKDTEKNKDEIQKLTSSLVENEAVLDFATEVKSLHKSIRDVDLQINQVDQKYKKKPFKDLPDERKKELKKLDKDQLEQRKTDLVENIAALKSPDKRAKQNVDSAEELQSLSKPSASENIIALESKLDNKLKDIKGTANVQSQELETREKYTKLFLGPDSLAQTDKFIDQKLSDNFEKTIKAVKLSTELKQNKIEKNKKWKNIGLGLLGLGIAIAACIPPAQALLGIALIGIGVVSGISAIYDFKVKRDSKLESEAELSLAESNLKLAQKSTAGLGQIDTPSVLKELQVKLTEPTGQSEKVEETVLVQSAPTLVTPRTTTQASNSATTPTVPVVPVEPISPQVGASSSSRKSGS